MVDAVAPALDAAVFRRVIGTFMSGVVVLTTTDGGRRHGMTVSAVSSLSLDPPMLLVCLSSASPTQQAVHRAGRFAVNVLGEDQGHLAELRRLAEATVPLVAGGHFTDVAAYVEANTRFHEFVVAATGIRALVHAYEQLSLPEVMARALTAGVAVDPHLVDDHLALVDAYDRGDPAAVKRIVIAHNDRAKLTQRAGLERAGGRL